MTRRLEQRYESWCLEMNIENIQYLAATTTGELEFEVNRCTKQTPRIYFSNDIKLWTGYNLQNKLGTRNYTNYTTAKQ